MDKGTDLHISLPQGLVAELDRVAEERQVKRVHLVRQAVAEYLKRIEAERTEQEMRAYADEMAAHSGELVRETGEHVARRLLRESEW